MLSQSLKNRLICQHEGLIEILANTGTEQLNKQPLTGKWSIRQNIAHLVRYQLEFIHRINMILTLPQPLLKRYNSDEDEGFAPAQSRETGDLLEHLKNDRTKIIEILLKLTESEKERTGVHPVAGKMVISEWVEFFLLHEAHHMLAIFQLVHFIE